ncbi:MULTISPECIES: TetR/AcrR family transcriptional regulator [Streptomyces]|uniref:TetR/AcrR family transcriptional regulator n=1 Tax=Streptomyces TaxID=1883 RepID=UPI0001AEF3F1|nr:MULTISPECIES: TetR/AcrR family transcriptional regulator [Streptomyces]PWJ06097.1 TetR/AcrR family transcriptional regulator [Streptomyces sp. NWU49]
MAEKTARVSRAEQKRRTRAALVYAARGLFVAQGYTATTADAVARAAHVSRATFYLHFRSKAEIVVELMRAVEPEVVASYEQLTLVEPTSSATERWLREHAALWRRHRMEFTAMEQALTNEEPVAEEWFALYGRLADAMATITGRLVARGLAAERARARVIALVMTIERAFYVSVVRDRPAFFEAIVPEIADALAHALRGDPAHSA